MVAEDRRKFWLVFLLLLTMVLSAALLSLAKATPGLYRPISLSRDSFPSEAPWSNGGSAIAQPPRECGIGDAPACPVRFNLAGHCIAPVPGRGRSAIAGHEPTRPCTVTDTTSACALELDICGSP